jgi:hypothetical protein
MPYIGKKPADIIATVIDTTTGTFSGEVDAGSLDVSGNADIDGITNLDNTNIDGTLDVSGDLTVDTNTLYVDSANNRVGINTTGSVRDLQIGDNTRSASILSLQTNSSGNGSIYFGDNTTTNAEYGGMIRYSHSDNAMLFWTSSTEAMRIDSSGRFMVGTTTEGEAGADDLTIATTGHTGMTIRSGTSAECSLFFSDGTSGADEYRGYVQYLHSANALRFGSNSAERMRIDSSGNLLVSKTAGGSGTAGIQLESGGRGGFTKDNAYVTFQNRLSSDGEISKFMKDGTTVGSIGVTTGRLTIGTDDTGLRFHATSDFISPWNISTNGARDGAIDLGGVSDRFKDLYLSNTAYTTYVNGGSGHTGQMHFTGSHDIRFVNNGSERMRIDSSGKLLVGMSVSSGSSDGIQLIQDGRIFSTVDGQFCTILNRKTSDGGIIEFRKDGTTVGNIGVHGGTKLYIGSGAAGLRFTDGNTDLINPYNTSTNADADGTVNLGYDGGRFKDLYLSGGVYLGGTSSANYLDDYEEGTWTPAVGGTATYNDQFGIYTKVGNVVTCQFRMSINNLGTGSTTTLSGFPFASSNVSQVQSGHCSYYQNIAVNTIYLSFYIENNATTAIFVGKSASGSTVDNAIALFGNNANVYGQITYRST